MDVKKIETAFKEILEAIDEDTQRDGLLDTPKRVAQSYLDFFSGVTKDPSLVMKNTIEAESKDYIIERDIDFYSMCEHHFVPFFGTVDIAYIPNEKIIGFGNIIEALEILSKRPQLQERLTSQLADVIQSSLECEGVMVIVKAKHLCMTMRGSKKENSRIITMASRGCFENDSARRLEIINLLK